MLTTGTVPEAVVHSRVRRLLERMDREGRLGGPLVYAAPVDEAMRQIFPSPGVLSQTAYETFLDPADRSVVYRSVQDAMTAPHSADVGDLQAAMRAAATTAGTASADEAGLRAVFGDAQWSTASGRYLLIQAKLISVSHSIATHVSTDYNLDAQETFLGGWASHAGGEMHLLSTVVADPLTAGSKATLLHEAAHLAHSSIDDHVYYGTPGYEAEEEAKKVNNAAHYEELPRRAWGASSYAGQTFTPGVSSTGAPLTLEQRIQVQATLYFRKVWDAAADVDDLLKTARRDQLVGTVIDAPTVARMLEVSPLMDLTLHTQAASPPSVTSLDVTTSESIARGASLAGDRVTEAPLALTAMLWIPEAILIPVAVSHVIDFAIAAYGGFLGDPARDRDLLDWLHNHYRDVFP